MADKTNAELFSIETSGADLTERSQPHCRTWKPLKCETNLVNQSRIEAVVGRRPKSLKNRIKGKTKILSKKASVSLEQCNDVSKDGSAANSSLQSRQYYSLWNTSEILFMYVFLVFYDISVAFL